MAFVPTQFLDNFADALKEFENFFDEKLEQIKVKPYETYVDITIPKGYSEVHHKVLKSKYLDAGWALVVFHIDYVRFYAKN